VYFLHELWSKQQQQRYISHAIQTMCVTFALSGSVVLLSISAVGFVFVLSLFFNCLPVSRLHLTSFMRLVPSVSLLLSRLLLLPPPFSLPPAFPSLHVQHENSQVSPHHVSAGNHDTRQRRTCSCYFRALHRACLSPFYPISVPFLAFSHVTSLLS